jgi:hypothetical protein
MLRGPGRQIEEFRLYALACAAAKFWTKFACSLAISGRDLAVAIACAALKAVSAFAVTFCTIFSFSSFVLPHAVSAISVMTLALSWAAAAVLA